MLDRPGLCWDPKPSGEITRKGSARTSAVTSLQNMDNKHAAGPGSGGIISDGRVAVGTSDALACLPEVDGRIRPARKSEQAGLGQGPDHGWGSGCGFGLEHDIAIKRVEAPD